MRLEVRTDTGPATGVMRALFEDQLPFATSGAINDTALDFQKVQRRHLDSIFEIRRPQFIERSIRIRRGEFATKRKLEATVRVDSAPSGRSESDSIVSKFETERRMRSFKGGGTMVPTQHTPRTATGIVRPSLRPSKLKLVAHKKGAVFSGKSNVMRGKHRTVFIRKPNGRGLVLQRRGSGPSSELVPIFFRWPSVRLTPNLKFVQNAERTVQDRFEDNFEKRWTKALRTASRRGTRLSTSANRIRRLL